MTDIDNFVDKTIIDLPEIRRTIAAVNRITNIRREGKCQKKS